MIPFLLGLLLLAGFLGAAFWFANQKTEKATRMVRLILGSGALIAGVVISLRGAVALGVPIGLFGLGMLGHAAQRPQRTRGGGTQVPKPGGPMSLNDAREILGVGPDADAETIRQAHRRLMKKLHPDTGDGSAALARQVQEARDLLLDHIEQAGK